MSKESNAAKAFAAKWKGQGAEKQQSQLFWLELMEKVLGAEHPTDLVRFEEKVKLSNTSFIDIMVPSTHTMIEQKSIGKELSESIKQSDGTLLTPFQQAKRYAIELPYSERPRWIVICNFRQFDIYDMERPNDPPTHVELADLEKDWTCLRFITDTTSTRIQKEMDLSREAGQLVGKIYDALLPCYGDHPSAQDYQDLNKLIVRLVFCFYAEDADLFGKHDQFHDYMASFAPKHFRTGLMELFKVLDQKEEARDRFMEPELAAFPYVNGSLFTENVPVPPISEDVRLLILDEGCAFDWSKISPTIFGAIFESTLNPATRRAGGMHYTSIENIHKVIDPLFLDGYRAAYAAAMQEKQPKRRHEKLRDLQEALGRGKYFDPACGSGNFLTESYLSLRRLENDILRELQKDTDLGLLQLNFVTIDQFYGIEINDFAVAVCKTALWIAEAQMLAETEEIVQRSIDFFPLTTNSNIHEGNALRMDWKTVVAPGDDVKIMGNPPFLGFTYMSAEQKADLLSLYPGKKNLDYVSCWYKKAADYIHGTNITAAFVSTNSITQGETVGRMWEDLPVHINFAYRTFVWNSEAYEKAHVYCVIIGFSEADAPQKRIYNGAFATEAANINPYLVDAPTVLVKSRNKPLCDVPPMVYGNKPADGGNLIIEDKDLAAFLKEDPTAEPFVRPFLGARGLLHGEKRWCLWLVGIAPADIKKHPNIYKRVAQCKAVRESSKAAAIRRFAEVPMRFAQVTQPDGKDYIIIPRHSSEKRRYIPMTFVKAGTIAADSVQIIPDATLYMFGVITSNVHMSWMRLAAGRLESRYRYSKDVVYNTFPWPTPTDTQRAAIERTAQGILDARALYPDSSLADLYDEVLMPKELREAHRKNDKAVMEAYGFWGRGINKEPLVVAELMKMYQALVAEGGETLRHVAEHGKTSGSRCNR